MNEEIKVYDPNYKVIGKQKLELCDVTTYARDNDAGIQIIDIYSVDDKIVSISPAIYITEGILVHDHDDMYKIVIPDEDDAFDDLAALYAADDYEHEEKHPEHPVYGCYDANGDGIPDCQQNPSPQAITDAFDTLVKPFNGINIPDGVLTKDNTTPSPNNIVDIPRNVKL